MIRSVAIFVVFLLFTLSSPLFAQVNTENFRKSDLAPGFHNALNLNFGATTGNTRVVTTRLQFRSDYVEQTYRGFFVGSYSQGSTGGTDFQNESFIHVRVVPDLLENLKGEIFYQQEQNPFRNLTSRNLVGAGLRAPITRPTLKLYVGIGLMWENERVAGEGLNQLLRSTNYVSLHRSIDDRISFVTTEYFQVHLGNYGDFRLLSENALTFRITDAMQWSLDLNARYDHQPPPGISPYDLSVTNGLSIHF